MYCSRGNTSLLNLPPSPDSSAKWVHLPFCCRTTFSEFAAKHAKDSRFKAIEKMKDREALFNEFITAARKKEKEDSKTRGEKVRGLLSSSRVSGVSEMGQSQFLASLSLPQDTALHFPRAVTGKHFRDVPLVFMNNFKFAVYWLLDYLELNCVYLWSWVCLNICVFLNLPKQ